MKIIKKIAGGIAILAVTVLVFGSGWYACTWYSEKGTYEKDENATDLKLPGETKKVVVTVNEVKAELLDISEWASQEGDYEVTKEVESKRCVLDDVSIPFTKNSVRITCKGVVKIGFDMDKVQPEVDTVSHKIYIHLPEPEEISNELFFGESMVVDEENNILNPIEFEDYQKLIQEIKIDGRAKAEEKGLSEKAQEHIKVLIDKFLECFDGYEVVYM